MKWYGNLYTGPHAAQRLDEIIQDVEDEEFAVPDLYLITLASNGIDQLDVIPVRRIAGRHAAARRLEMIVGAAISRAEAIELVREIAAETYKETGDCDIRAYLNTKQHVMGQNAAPEAAG